MPADDVVTLVKLIEEEVLNNHLLHLVLERMIEEPDKSAIEIINENNLRQINDGVEIEKLCRDVIESNKKLVEMFKGGKRKVFKALVGEVYQLSKQRANMKVAVEKLEKMLK